MSADWLEQFQLAAIKGSDQRLHQLLEDIPPAHTDLVAMLTDWIDNFQFHQLLDLIRNIDAS